MPNSRSFTFVYIMFLFFFVRVRIGSRSSAHYNPYLSAFSELFVFVQDEADDVTEKSDLPLGKTGLQELLPRQQGFITEEITQNLKHTRTHCTLIFLHQPVNYL